MADAERSSGDKVSTQHRILDTLLRSARKAAGAGDAAAATRKLAGLGRALDAHFVLEEEHYFPTIRRARPDLAEALDTLTEEHVDMRRSLGEIAERLEARAFEDATRTLADLDAALRGHEKTEEELLSA